MASKREGWREFKKGTRVLAILACAYTALAPGHAFSLSPDLPDATAAAQEPFQKVYLKIMPLGDSITFGTPNPRYGGYRHLLGALLTRDGYHFAFVGSQQSGDGVIPSPSNEGHPGWTILRIKQGIDGRGWLETYQPDIILLHIGTNDLRPRIGGASSAPDNLSALLDDILARLPPVHVIVAQIIPFRAGPDESHHTYNGAIPGIAAAKGPRVSLVDMQSVLSPGDYADGLHPKASGYDKMARAWEQALRAVISVRGAAAASLAADGRPEGAHAPATPQKGLLPGEHFSTRP